MGRKNMRFMIFTQQRSNEIKEGYCGHGNKPPCSLCAEKSVDTVSVVEDAPSPQERNIRRSQSLIESVGGVIDTDTAPYKKFDTTKHERLYIQKGELEGSGVVFKIGEKENSMRLEDESRNLKVLEQAEQELDMPLDVHIVKQIGDLYKNDEMVGLATEYLVDDKEVKAELSGKEKIAVIGRVIESLQQIPVSDEVKETSGLTVHDADKITHDGQYFVQTLQEDGFFDSATADRLKVIFQSAGDVLSDEPLVFVHGDAHGDNIFVQRGEGDEPDLSLLDIEGLRISNRYHDWSDILNKAAFFQHLEQTRPDLFTPIANNVKDMWLDSTVEFDEEAIMRDVCSGDEQRINNFRITRIYDLLGRAMSSRGSEHPFEQEAGRVRMRVIENQLARLSP